MKIYFSHGKESGPWGEKIKQLANISVDNGFEVDSIDYSDIVDPDLRAKKLTHILKSETGPFLLVGSSMGGYVSLVAAEEINPEGIFLLAPALYMPDYMSQSFKPMTTNIEIVHGWSDDTIPVENSIIFSKAADCSLHLISGDHRLTSSLDEVKKIFIQFISNYL